MTGIAFYLYLRCVTAGDGHITLQQQFLLIFLIATSTYIALFSSDDEEENEQEEGWGKKKAYWSGDTADLEIGQDVQDAEDEEEAAEVRKTLWDYLT